MRLSSNRTSKTSDRPFVVPPRSPQPNCAVARAHRTRTEGFYQVTDSTFNIAELAAELLKWERIYIPSDLRRNSIA